LLLVSLTFFNNNSGSGKTYTMEGVAEHGEYGISYRTIQKLFHLLSLRAQQQVAANSLTGLGVGDSTDEEREPEDLVTFEFSLTLSMLEIYNEEVFDLLAVQGSSTAEKKMEAIKAGGKSSLEIRQNQDGRIEVPNLTKEDVTSIEDVMKMLKRGNANRATATTDLNEHSSRSHMVLLVEVSSGLSGQPRNKGTLYLVDLAGSERVRKSNVEGEQLREAGFINKSLSALGNVMEALDRRASHVPYRDSKLTYLLQNSLGGNSRTMMVVTVCPMDVTFDESAHALQFATRVRRIQLGAAQRNVTSKNLEETVKSLTTELKSLTSAKERSERQLLTLKRDNTRIQDKLQNLAKSRAQTHSDSRTLEVLKKNNNDMATRWQKEKNMREETAEELEKARKELRRIQQLQQKAARDNETLIRQLDEKEYQLAECTKELREAKEASSAATIRARKVAVLSSRPAPPAKATASSPPNGRPQQTFAGNITSETTAAASSPPKRTPTSDDVAEIRQKVLVLLEKHDRSKLNRIDIIMDKFQGKEALLLEKMIQRYEGASSSPTSTSSNSSVVRNSMKARREQALEKHKERFQKKNEKGGGS
jgi:kinesin family protein C2/C3